MTLLYSTAHLCEIESILQKYSEFEAKLPSLLAGSRSDLAEAIFCLYSIQSYLSELRRLMPDLSGDFLAALDTKRQDIAMTVQLLRDIRQSTAFSYP